MKRFLKVIMFSVFTLLFTTGLVYWSPPEQVKAAETGTGDGTKTKTFDWDDIQNGAIDKYITDHEWKAYGASFSKSNKLYRSGSSDPIYLDKRCKLTEAEAAHVDKDDIPYRYQVILKRNKVRESNAYWETVDFRATDTPISSPYNALCKDSIDVGYIKDAKAQKGSFWVNSGKTIKDSEGDPYCIDVYVVDVQKFVKNVYDDPEHFTGKCYLQSIVKVHHSKTDVAGPLYNLNTWNYETRDWDADGVATHIEHYNMWFTLVKQNVKSSVVVHRIATDDNNPYGDEKTELAEDDTVVTVGSVFRMDDDSLKSYVTSKGIRYYLKGIYYKNASSDKRQKEFMITMDLEDNPGFVRSGSTRTTRQYARKGGTASDHTKNALIQASYKYTQKVALNLSAKDKLVISSAGDTDGSVANEDTGEGNDRWCVRNVSDRNAVTYSDILDYIGTQWFKSTVNVDNIYLVYEKEGTTVKTNVKINYWKQTGGEAGNYAIARSITKSTQRGYDDSKVTLGALKSYVDNKTKGAYRVSSNTNYYLHDAYIIRSGVSKADNPEDDEDSDLRKRKSIGNYAIWSGLDSAEAGLQRKIGDSAIDLSWKSDDSLGNEVTYVYNYYQPQTPVTSVAYYYHKSAKKKKMVYSPIWFAKGNGGAVTHSVRASYVVATEGTKAGYGTDKMMMEADSDGNYPLVRYPGKSTLADNPENAAKKAIGQALEKAGYELSELKKGYYYAVSRTIMDGLIGNRRKDNFTFWGQDGTLKKADALIAWRGIFSPDGKTFKVSDRTWSTFINAIADRCITANSTEEPYVANAKVKGYHDAKKNSWSSANSLSTLPTKSNRTISGTDVNTNNQKGNLVVHTYGEDTAKLVVNYYVGAGSAEKKSVKATDNIWMLAKTSSQAVDTTSAVRIKYNVNTNVGDQIGCVEEPNKYSFIAGISNADYGLDGPVVSGTTPGDASEESNESYCYGIPCVAGAKHSSGALVSGSDCYLKFADTGEEGDTATVSAVLKDGVTPEDGAVPTNFANWIKYNSEAISSYNCAVRWNKLATNTITINYYYYYKIDSPTVVKTPGPESTPFNWDDTTPSAKPTPSSTDTTTDTNVSLSGTINAEDDDVNAVVTSALDLGADGNITLPNGCYKDGKYVANTLKTDLTTSAYLSKGKITRKSVLVTYNVPVSRLIRITNESPGSTAEDSTENLAGIKVQVYWYEVKVKIVYYVVNNVTIWKPDEATVYNYAFPNTSGTTKLTNGDCRSYEGDNTDYNVKCDRSGDYDGLLTYGNSAGYSFYGNCADLANADLEKLTNLVVSPISVTVDEGTYEDDTAPYSDLLTSAFAGISDDFKASSDSLSFTKPTWDDTYTNEDGSSNSSFTLLQETDASVLSMSQYLSKDTEDVYNAANDKTLGDVRVPISGKTKDEVFAKTKIPIDAAKLNTGQDKDGPLSQSSLKARFAKVVTEGRDQSTEAAELNYTNSDVGNVTLHTPIAIKTKIVPSDDSVLQLSKDASKDSAEAISLGSSFTLKFDYKAAFTEYDNIDTEKYKSSSGVRVKFSFPVYVVSGSTKTYYAEKKMITLDASKSYKFYVPYWAKEGNQTVTAYADALNVTGHDGSKSILDKTADKYSGEYANYVRDLYSAHSTVSLNLSGKMFNLSTYDYSDYPTLEKVFRLATGS